MQKAWIVVYIDTRTSPATVHGAAVALDSRSPPTLGGLRTLPYMEFTGDTFGEAARAAEEYLTLPHLAWLGPLYVTPEVSCSGGVPRRLYRQWPKETRLDLPPWARCLLLNLASVVWFVAGQQAEYEMMMTDMLSYNNWKEVGIYGGGMSGDPVPVPSPTRYSVKRHLLEASNPAHLTEVPQ